MSPLWTGTDITRERFLHFALRFEAWLHHGNCSKCSIQILVSGHTHNVEAFVLPHRHDSDGISALPIHRLMSHSTNLGDTRTAIGDKMYQEFSSNVREASIYPPIQQQMRSVQCIGTALWGWSVGPSRYKRRTEHLTLQTKHVPRKAAESGKYRHRRVKYHRRP